MCCLKTVNYIYWLRDSKVFIVAAILEFNPDLVSVVGFKALKPSKAPCLQDKNLLTVYR